jgi:hypothetical protein
MAGRGRGASLLVQELDLLREEAMTELAHRSNHGVNVQLLWSRSTGDLVVAVDDIRTGESFTLDAPRERALDVFNHPYAYATPRLA